MAGGGEPDKEGIQIEGGQDSKELKEVYNSIKESPNFPKAFKAVNNGTTKQNINNKKLLDKLRKLNLENGKNL